jgi:hypothetical protein
LAGGRLPELGLKLKEPLIQRENPMEEIMEKLSRLDAEDRQKISDFIAILLEQNKYDGLRKEIAERRAEIERRDVLSHDEFWADA